MGTTTRPSYDLRRIVFDMMARGWNANVLARRARLDPKTVVLFLSGARANPVTGFKISKALKGDGAAYLRPVAVRKPRSQARAS